MAGQAVADREMAVQTVADRDMADEAVADQEIADKAVAESLVESDDGSDDGSDDDSEEEDWTVCKRANPMLEVFGIRYIGSDDVQPRDQLGSIKLSSLSGFRYIYNLQMVDETMELIKSGDEIAVMAEGPIHLYTCSSSLHFDIFRGACKGVIKDTLSDWHVDSLKDAYLKRIWLLSLDGTPEIVVFMGFYAHAMVAKVEVTTLLANNFNNSAADVYGVVAASNTRMDTHMCTSCLFLKKDHKTISVGTDGVIPLSRSHVAVPFGSRLIIDISLHVDGYNHKASMEFPSLHLGDQTEVDENKFFKVKVAWNVFYDQSLQ